MGMTTEIYVNVNLKEDTPDSIIRILNAMVEHKQWSDDVPRRWQYLFSNHSYCTPYTSCARLTYDGFAERWSLLGKGDIKNYKGEIEAFFDWIKPYVDGEPDDFIGYHRYEEYKEPTLVYL